MCKGEKLIKFIDQHRSDEVLLRRCVADSDREAFAVVYERHRRNFYRYLLKLSADPVIAEDVSQQCWLKLLESFAGSPIYKPSRLAKFSTFLYTLGRNLYIDQFVRRHEHARCQSLERTPAAASSTASACPQQSAHNRQLAEKVVEALRRLPLEQREVISLWAAGFSAQSIATIVQVPLNTVLSRKRYAISRLRYVFTQLGLIDSVPDDRPTDISSLRRAVAGQSR